MFVRAMQLSLASALAFLVAAPAFAGDVHEVRASQAKATVGAKGSTSVTLAGKNGWHLNEEFPIQLKLTPGAGVTVDKGLLGRKDLAESTKESARFDVAFTANEAGAKTIDAEAHFAVCQASSCRPVTEKVVLALDVAAAAPPPAAAPAPAPEPETKGKKGKAGKAAKAKK
jgi:hypothetical protein